MLIETPQKVSTVHDYDIVFSSGLMIPIPINPDLGDMYTEDGARIRIHLAAKPSMADPSKMLPAEDITLFLAHIASIQHRERVVVERTLEEQLEWGKMMQELTGSVQ